MQAEIRKKSEYLFSQLRNDESERRDWTAILDAVRCFLRFISLIFVFYFLYPLDNYGKMIIIYAMNRFT